MSKTKSSVRSRLVRAGIATVAATATVTAATISPAFAAVVPLTLSSATGPSGATANTMTITASSSTAWLTGVTAPITTYSLPTCQQTYNTVAQTAVAPTTATSGNVLQANATDTVKISNTKATMSLPSLILSPSTATTTKYNVCVYASSTTGDPLIGTSSYSVAPAATLANTNTITPSSGPALGGSTITVTGTGFPTTAAQISATLGGVALTNITPISTTSFTAVTPYRASGTVALAVTTPAGTVTKQSAFTYSNGIVISPNTASSTTATSTNPVYVDVLGSNFLAMNFGSYTAATDAGAGSATANSQVFLVDGAYTAGTTTLTYTNGPIARCTGVIVISDSELICQLNLLTGKLVNTTGASAGATAPTGTVPDGTYTLTVVSNGATATGATNDPTLSPTVTPAGITVSDISSGSTFTVAKY